MDEWTFLCFQTETKNQICGRSDFIWNRKGRAGPDLQAEIMASGTVLIGLGVIFVRFTGHIFFISVVETWDDNAMEEMKQNELMDL